MESLSGILAFVHAARLRSMGGRRAAGHLGVGGGQERARLEDGWACACSTAARAASA